MGSQTSDVRGILANQQQSGSIFGFARTEFHPRAGRVGDNGSDDWLRPIDLSVVEVIYIATFNHTSFIVSNTPNRSLIALTSRWAS